MIGYIEGRVLARRERFAKQGARRAGLFARRRPQSKQGYGA